MQNMHEWDVYCIVRSEELGVRSDGRGAQNLEAPQYPFYKGYCSAIFDSKHSYMTATIRVIKGYGISSVS